MFNLLISNTILAIVFFIYNMKKCREEAIYKAAIIFFLPIFGAAYFVIFFILQRKYNCEDELGDYLEHYENKINTTVYSKIDKDKGINIVPANEALILNENKIKRSMLIEVLKGDVEQHIPILKKALENDDTETSHYAATAIAEIKKNYVTTIQQTSMIYENDRNNVDNLISYIEILREYLESELLDEKTLKKYKYLYSEKLAELLKIYEYEEKYYVDKINCDLDLNDMPSAKEYCEKFYKKYSNSEEAYLMYLKFYYKIKDYSSFEGKLEQLKKSPITLTNRALNIVRFWNTGDNHEY